VGNPTRVQLNKDDFEVAEGITSALAKFENVVIHQLQAAGSKTQNFFLRMLQKMPHTVLNDETLETIWETARNTDQDIVHWIMDTYRMAVSVCGTKGIYTAIQELYVESLFFGDIVTLYGDKDLGDRIILDSDAALQVLQTHRWPIVLLALYSIDFEGVINEEGESKPTS
tara:strand:+ start:204172 stop:204681 length:510 start_codon:yes stop_codon:yes gene_type:complete